MMSGPVNDKASAGAGKVSWEIYEIGAPHPYGWSWRCRIGDTIVRQGAVMHSTIHGAIDDAVEHGMEEPASAIRTSAD